jgi:hypothetical protein
MCPYLKNKKNGKVVIEDALALETVSSWLHLNRNICESQVNWWQPLWQLGLLWQIKEKDFLLTRNQEMLKAYWQVTLFQPKS